MNVFSVIVTYKPDWLAVNLLCDQLSASMVTTVVVDNSEVDVKGVTINLVNGKLLTLGENKGIATAQNKGIDYCIEKGADIIVFFDQDSVISDDFISKLVAPIMTKNENIVAPTFIDAEKGFFYPIVSVSRFGLRTKTTPAKHSPAFYTNTAISSGTAVKTSVFNIVGKMQDDLFIDYVDTEWCLRCHHAGIKVLILPDNQMIHSIGDKSFNVLGFTVPVHSAYRRYYRVRNSFELLRLKHIPILLGIREIIFSIIHQALLVLTQHGKRKAYIKYGLIGVWHGIIGVKGHLENRDKTRR
jgi:rhamnosyltransferase